MGPTLELDTVSHADKARSSRPYQFDEPKRGLLSTVIGSVLGLGAALFTQRLLWGEERPHAPLDDDNIDKDRLAPPQESAVMPPGDGEPDAPPAGTHASLGESPALMAAVATDGPAPDDDPSDHPRGRGSGTAPVHATGHGDAPQQAQGDHSAHLASQAGPPSDQPIFHGGGGGGGSDAPRPQHRTSGAQSGGGNSDPTTPPTRTNRAPVVSAPVVLDASAMNLAVSITLAALLEHASDPDGDQLKVVGLTASSGSLVAAGDGTWTWTPVAGDDTQVAFHYEVSDGKVQTAQTASLDLLPAPPPPNPEPDPFAGTPGDDVITGTSHDDVIDAKAGHDVVDADAGNDIVYGGEGNDVLHGGAGDDVIYAGSGNDTVFGGGGNDIIFAGDGDDLVFGDAGNDIVYGGAGDDAIHGGAGDDILNGGDGADRLAGDEGHDIVFGDGGDDTIVASAGDGDDSIDGGEGSDTYDLTSTSHGVVVDLASGTSDGDETGHDTLAGIENVVGGAGNDTLIGDEGANVLSGGAGDDELVGAGGSDSLSGGDGDDTFVAAADDGDDVIDGGDGVDTYDASAARGGVVIDLEAGVADGADTGTDRLSGIENAVGGSGDDVLVGDAHRNVFVGGAGADTFVLGRASGDDNPAHWDQIKDFSVGDRIDVSLRPFDDTDAPEPALEFEGPYGADDEAPQARAGKLQYSFSHSDDGDHTLVVGWSSDGNTEIVQIDLCGHHDLHRSDFTGVH